MVDGSTFCSFHRRIAMETGHRGICFPRTMYQFPSGMKGWDSLVR